MSKTINAKKFIIDTYNIRTDNTLFKTVLENALNDTTIQQRMRDAESDNNQKYVITSYSVSNDIIFGIFAKIIQDKSLFMDNEQFNKQNVSLNDLAAIGLAGQDGIVADYMYFCVKGNILVINSGKHIKIFEKYINDIIDYYNNIYRINPYINIINEIEFSKVKYIVIKEKGIISQRHNTTLMQNISNMISGFATSLIEAADNSNQFRYYDIFSAEIKLKSKLADTETYQDDEIYRQTLQTMIKTGIIDELEIHTKDNRTISGSKLEDTYSFKVNTLTEAELPDENEVKEHLIGYVNDN